jgi:RNA polymerase sigma factor (sigma-70 family)
MTARVESADFGAFYEATYQRAYRTALAIVAEPALAADVTQDAYVAAFRGRARFGAERPPEAWLVRIVVNAAISATRKRRVHWTEPFSFDAPSATDHAQRSVNRLSVISALETLPPQQRAATVLRFYLDYDYAAIAACLGTNVGTVGSWLSRSLERLRSELDPRGTGAVRATHPAEDHRAL